MRIAILIIIVNKYKYLGLFFSTKSNFNAAVRDFSGKAKNAVMRVLSVLYRIESYSLGLFVKLFDSQTQPALWLSSGVCLVLGHTEKKYSCLH